MIHFLQYSCNRLLTSLALISALCLTSCHIVSDQGPTGMNKLQREQARGKLGTENYVIIDINKGNLNRYNKIQYKKSGVIPKAKKSKMYNDLIRPYDKLTLLVIDTAEQGAFPGARGPVTFGPLEVPLTGTISIPYAGNFSVLGKSINSVQNEIGAKYSTVFNTAKISLNRVERQPLRASVIGLANAPGQHPIERQGVTLAEMVALSGGTKEEPYLCDYLIHRDKKTYTLNNDQITKLKILTQDGDLVEIKRSEEHSITMMGSVNRPGNHKFPKSHALLSDFLGEGRGINVNRADATGVFIFRKAGSRTHLYRFNLQKPEGMILASKFNVHGKDRYCLCHRGATF